MSDQIRKIEKELVKKLQAETLKHNCVAQLAKKDKRDYITPEDIGEAFKSNPEDKVRKDVLEVLASGSGFSWEDGKLCAYVAFKGKEE